MEIQEGALTTFGKLLYKNRDDLSAVAKDIKDAASDPKSLSRRGFFIRSAVSALAPAKEGIKQGLKKDILDKTKVGKLVNAGNAALTGSSVADNLRSKSSEISDFIKSLGKRMRMKSQGVAEELIQRVLETGDAVSVVSSLFESRNWIQKAVKNKGAFTRKAEKAGLPTQEYANKVIQTNQKEMGEGGKRSYDTRTVRQAHLAKRFAEISRKRFGV